MCLFPVEPFLRVDEGEKDEGAKGHAIKKETVTDL